MDMRRLSFLKVHVRIELVRECSRAPATARTPVLAYGARGSKCSRTYFRRWEEPRIDRADTGKRGRLENQGGRSSARIVRWTG
jgi:protein tyrosine phosphatase (PTP) superfamily phosphohydrolase (DUF442 family)